MTTGLWERLEPKEVEGVLAHELSHVANRDVLIMTLASFFAMLAALLTRFGLYAGMWGGGDRRDNNNGPPVWLIVFAVSILVYAISFVLIRTISRYREYAADRGSALITGAPEYLMSALQKISSQMALIPNRDLREVEGMSAFFIIPAHANTAAAELFMDHPPLEKRLAALAEIAREMGRPVACRVGLRDALFGRNKLAEPKRRPALLARHRRGDAGDGARTDHVGRGGDRVQAAVVRRVPERLRRRRPAARGGRAAVRHDDRAQERPVRLRLDRRARPGSRGSRRGGTPLADELTAKGFGSQLLAAIFRFQGGEHPVYWIYGFKRGAFWPFVPLADQKRDNATELELKAKLEHELPIEQDLTRWLALFDAPV